MCKLTCKIDTFVVRVYRRVHRTFTSGLEVEGEREEGKEGHVENNGRPSLGHGFLVLGAFGMK